MSHYREKFKELKPSEVSYSVHDKTLIIRENNFPVDNPKLAFIEVMQEFYEKNTYETLKTGTRIHIDTIIGDNVALGCNCTIGGFGFGYERTEGSLVRIPHHGHVVIEDGVTIHNNVNIDRAVKDATIIGKGSAIDSHCHIGHNARIGHNVLIAANSTIGGSAVIGNNVFIGCNSFVKQKIKIGEGAIIGAGSVVLKDVPSGETWVGNPAKKI